MNVCVCVCVSVSAILMHLCAEEGEQTKYAWRKMLRLLERSQRVENMLTFYSAMKTGNSMHKSSALPFETSFVCFVSFRFLFVIYLRDASTFLYNMCGLHLFFPPNTRSLKINCDDYPWDRLQLPSHIIAHKFTTTHGFKAVAHQLFAHRAETSSLSCCCWFFRREKKKAVHDCWYAWKHGLKTIDAITSSFRQNWFKHYFRVWQNRWKFKLIF